jgi:hypothetical protein
MIIAAAIKTADGRVWSVTRPGRHDAVFLLIAEAIAFDIGSHNPSERDRWNSFLDSHRQGFVTDKGVFLDRAEALQHAMGCGQIERLVNPGAIPVLTSEDLW